MSTALHSLPRTTQESITSVLSATFEQAFGVSFHNISTKQLPSAPVWDLHSDCAEAGGFDRQAKRLSPNVAFPQIRTFSVSPQNTLIVVTPDANDPDNHLAGEVEVADRVSLLRTAAFAFQVAEERIVAANNQARAHENETHIISYAEQVSDSFEELVYLRELAGYLEQCEVPRDTVVVAETMLPSLRELVGAESMVLIKADGQAAMDNDEQRLVVTNRYGSDDIKDSTCKAVVDFFGSKAHNGHPVVLNHFTDSAQHFELLGLRNLVLLPVRRGEFHFGWLLALNKVPSAFLADPENSLGFDEFGTSEAGLMQAATLLLATHARNLELFREKESLVIGTVMSLVQTLEARDLYTRGHSDRVADIARILAIEIGLSDEEVEHIHLTGLLHDIGKVGIPDEILHKPDKLSDKEFAIIQQHPVIGHRILKDLSSISYVLPGVLYHHESIDGTGYPEGLQGDAIPLMARILAVADGYDAMTSDRPYRDGMPTQKAESIILENRGIQWDSDIVDAFFRRIHEIRELGDCQVNQDATVDEAQSEKCLATNA
jgi:HD-GYP domain-containing protein (c-di-GMP phosphodiesterase class II)